MSGNSGAGDAPAAQCDGAVATQHVPDGERRTRHRSDGRRVSPRDRVARRPGDVTNALVTRSTGMSDTTCANYDDDLPCKSYEIDLNAKNAKLFRKALRPYVDAGRPL